MPELVEVENYRQILLALKNEKINSVPKPLSVQTPSSSPPKVFPSDSELKFIKKCIVEDVERKGKLLRLKLKPSVSKTGCEHYLYLHMGMSGRISAPNNIPSLESLTKSDTFPPPHTHLILESNGEKVAYSDPRKFGGVSLGDPLSAQWEEFALDAFDPNSSLYKLIGCRKGVKSLLLDQRAIVSGVGNWIADEILYQSKIHPDQNYLTAEEVGELKDSLDMVLKRGVECLAKKESFPEEWIFHKRWSKGKNSKLKDANGRGISFLKSGGRTSAIVPSIQKKKSRKPSKDESQADAKGSKKSIKKEKVTSLQEKKWKHGSLKNPSKDEPQVDVKDFKKSVKKEKVASVHLKKRKHEIVEVKRRRSKRIIEKGN